MAARIHSAVTINTSSTESQSQLPSPSYTPPSIDTSPLLPRILAVFRRTWDLGLTAFGGPPVHFTILHQRFVQSSVSENGSSKTASGAEPWLDEQTFQELFAVCQSLPGPASTKMLFCIALIHAGVPAAFLAFVIWSLPGAIVMYGLALGVGQMSDILPSPVYALLSGLNASTVGVVALAAVQLAEKAAKDKMTRILVIWGGCAGLCYNALWYFPVLIVAGGIVCAMWDVWVSRYVGKVKTKWEKRRQERRRRNGKETTQTSDQTEDSVEMEPVQRARNSSDNVPRKRQHGNQSVAKVGANLPERTEATSSGERLSEPQQTVGSEPVMDSDKSRYYGLSVPTGVGIIALVIAIFIALILVRTLVHDKPRPLDILATMYQAGILIFGGGPVVIPLLRDYVVDPGWVSSRDFLLGLAIIQALPGPNFNFSVYLGALAMARTGYHSLLGAVLSFVAIFAPGLLLTLGIQGLWKLLRTKPAVTSVLRGINATAVGLVFTAVYRLWEIGYLTPERSSGQSLAMEPWWVVVAALTYCEVAYFKVPPAAAIVFGVVLGLCWYGAVGRG